MKNINQNLLPIAIIIAGVLIAGAFFYTKQSAGVISMEEAGEKSIAFINATLEDQGVIASLIDVYDEGEVYRIHLKIEETEYDSYLTKSGKFLFPSGYLLEDQKAQQESSVEPSSLSDFAQCLTDSGAKFYGAFWCGHCQNQKEMFGQAQDLLPYVECSTESGQGQLDICNDEGVTGYPTWIFADGTRESGELSFQKLSDKTGCPLE